MGKKTIKLPSISSPGSKSAKLFTDKSKTDDTETQSAELTVKQTVTEVPSPRYLIYPMTDEIVKSDNAEDGDKVAKDTKVDTETKETKETKPRTVSFNRDVHVKRFGESTNIDILLTRLYLLLLERGLSFNILIFHLSVYRKSDKRCCK